MTSLYPTLDRPQAGPFVARRVAALRERGVEVVVIAAPTYRHGGLRRHMEMAWAALTARGRFDGVEGHVLFPASLIALLAARLRRVPLVVYAHGFDVVVAARQTPIHRWLARLVARGAGHVVTNSADTAGYVRRLGVEAVVVPPGVDMDRFRPGRRDEARTRLGLRPDARIALYVGSLDERKGADVFGDAVDRAGGWLGVVVGDGPLRATLAARHPGLRLVGPVTPGSVGDWMVAADVLVVPSRREPLGLAAIEALACGTPVIASATGGLAGIVQPGVNGLLVPPGDPDAVAQALEQLADDGLRAGMAVHARASVATHDLRAVSEEMARVWGSLGVVA